MDDVEDMDVSWEINLDTELAGVSYEEEDADITSDWSTFYHRTSLNVANNDKENFEGEVEFGMFYTATDTENWDVGSLEYQTNDMYFWGLDAQVLGGWAINFEDTPFTVTPLGGYGYKFIRFSRTDFNILNIITSTEVVDEDFNIHHLDLGAKFDYELNEKTNIFAKSLFGFVIYNEADNSSLGDIEGDGGYIIDTEIGLNYFYKDNMSLKLSGFINLQHLDGGDKDKVIWPDNDLNVYGANIGFKRVF